jgi:hypothetical protein
VPPPTEEGELVSEEPTAAEQGQKEEWNAEKMLKKRERTEEVL